MLNLVGQFLIILFRKAFPFKPYDNRKHPSLIVLNMGFEPNFSPASMRRIAVALTERFKNRSEQQLFPLKEMENLNDTERVKAEEYWARMQEEGKMTDGND